VSTSSLNPGTRLGPYEVIDTIGAGGMGVVFRARDTRLHRTVALKVLLEGPSSATTANQLLQEARSASALNHPNICTVHEVGEDGGRAFIVMEYVEGRPLNVLIPAEGLPLDSVLRYGHQIADALAHAHDRAVLHRDLKTANVILTESGRVKIVDFGLARQLPQVSQDDVTSSMAQFGEGERLGGTLAYMAPEVLQGAPPGIASDIWGFGVLLYEMATGHLPFVGRNVFDVTSSILRSPPQSLPAHVPASLRTIIARCLTKEPGQRYHTAGEVRAALEAVRSDSSLLPGLLIGPEPPPASTAKSKRVTVLAILALAAATTAIVWNIARARRAAPPVAGSGRLVQIVSSDRQAFDPAISADGTMVAYVAEDETGQFDLYVSRVAGGARVRVTNDAAREIHPRFSPDGERIAFSRRTPDNPRPEVCIVPPFGGPISVVAQRGSQPSWSPGGDRLVFLHAQSEGSSSAAIATSRLDGSDLRVVVPIDGAYPFLRAPAWSPDGRSIAFVRGTGGIAGELWMVPAQGGTPTRLSSDPPSVFSDDPTFSADGRSIVHASNRGGATNVWSLPIDGGPAVRLTTGPGPDEVPTVDRQGRIAFMNSRWTNQLAIRTVDGGEARTLVRHTPFLWGPSFSPDGGTIAYSRSEVDGSWHVWLVGADGTSPRRLTSSDSGEVYPRWAPDGRSILYHTWAAPRHVGRVSRDGGPQSSITPAGIDASFPDLSPDGRTLAFVVNEGQLERVFVMPLTDGPVNDVRRLLTPGSASLPRWSPDGAWIAFAKDRGYFGGIWVIHPDGSGLRRVTATGGWPVWWPDGRRLAYLKIGGDGSQQIQIVTLDGTTSGNAIPIRFQGSNYPIDVSRDGRSIVTTNSAHISSEIWVLDPRTQH